MPTGGTTQTTQNAVTHRRANRGWRTSVLAHAEALRSEVVLGGDGGRYTVDLAATPPTVTRGTASENDVRVARMVLGYVDEAMWFATKFSWPNHWINGSHNESAWARLHVAQELIVELMSPTRLASYVPTAAFACRRGLAPRDPRRAALDRVVKSVSKAPPARPEYVRGVLRDALRASNARNDLRYHRARSLRNLTIAIAAFLLLMTGGAVGIGMWRPTAVPMCLEGDAPEAPVTGGFRAPGRSDGPPPQVCPTGRARPTGGDVALVALIGMAAASISAARALTGATRRLGPYSPVAAQGTLKIVMGALFAIFGVTLLRAGWVPGVDDVDTGAEILAWALLFGYAQQALTGLLDQRAEKALSTEQQPAPSATDDAEPVPDEPDDGGDLTAPADGTDVTADVPADPADGAADPAADAPAPPDAGGAAAALPDNPPDEGAAAGGAAVEPDAPDDEMAPIDEADAGEPEEMAPPEPPSPRKAAAAKRPAKKAAPRR